MAERMATRRSNHNVNEVCTKIQPVVPRAKRGRCRQHSIEFKRSIVAKSLVAGTSVSRIAREFNTNANQVFTWRKQFAAI
jgi:transposase